MAMAIREQMEGDITTQNLPDVGVPIRHAVLFTFQPLRPHAHDISTLLSLICLNLTLACRHSKLSIISVHVLKKIYAYIPCLNFLGAVPLDSWDSDAYTQQQALVNVQVAYVMDSWHLNLPLQIRFIILLIYIIKKWINQNLVTIQFYFRLFYTNDLDFTMYF